MNRRAFLTAIGTAATTGLAGCQQTPDGTPTESPEPPTRTTEPPGGTASPAPPTTEPPSMPGPELAVDGFDVELFADFDRLDAAPKAFYMVLADGSRGFDPGLYVTGGPSVGGPPTDSDRIVRVTPDGEPEVFVSGLTGTESAVFARGEFGDGLLVAEPQDLRVSRLTPEGEMEPFAENVGGTPEESPGPFPFGPTGMAYAPDGDTLYVADFFGGRVHAVSPDGSVERAVSLVGIDNPKSAIVVPPGRRSSYGGNYLVSNFTAGEEPAGEGVVGVVEGFPESGEVRPLLEGLDGIEWPVFGPGGAFGDDLYVPTQSTIKSNDGTLYTATAEGERSPFLTGIDSAHVVFDTAGILGGGMFVSDFHNGFEDGEPVPAAGRVWRVTDA